MKLSTDDESFGLQIARVEGSEFFRIRLFFDGAVLGDYEPAIVWQDLRALSMIANVDGKQLDPTQPAPALVVKDALVSDEALREACLVHLGESFDAWLVYGYIYADYIVFLHSEHSDVRLANLSFTLTSIAANDYWNVVRTAQLFYGDNMNVTFESS